jgi:hypothetical protein
MQSVLSVCGLRIAVAHLGEKAQLGWWDTAFLNSTGCRYLQLIYPKTAASACVTAASQAAGHEHDERIGKGRVAHLFRLSADMELKLRTDLAALHVSDLEKICSREAAFRLLDEIAANAEPAAGAGPAQIGAIKDLATTESRSRIAATYASAFRSGTKIFPYFA